MVSVIIPTFNRAYILTRAIKSVLAQTYTRFELLIVDDGSTDDTKKLIGSFADKRIRYIELEENKGTSAARNIGIMNAEYDWIAFLDSDDEWHENKLKAQIELLQNAPADTGVVYCKYLYQNADKNIKGVMPMDTIPDYEGADEFFRRLLGGNVVATPCMMVKKACFQDAGLYDETLPCLEDYELVLRIGEKYGAVFSEEILVDVYATKDCVSNNIAGDLIVSSTIIGKYKKKMIEYGVFNSVVGEYLEKAKMTGYLERATALLEKVLIL